MRATTHLVYLQAELMSIAYPLGLNPIWTNFRAQRQVNYTSTLSGMRQTSLYRGKPWVTIWSFICIALLIHTSGVLCYSSSQFKRISHIDMLLKLNFANRCSSIMTYLAEEMAKMPLEDDCKPQNIQHALTLSLNQANFI